MTCLKTFSLAAWWLVALGVVPARADMLASFSGSGTEAYDTYRGQSFTTVTLQPENHVAFNLVSTANAPVAEGTGFLLSKEYLGAHAALSSSTPGYLGQAVASGGYYTFSPDLVLQPNTQYFFYENKALADVILNGGYGYAGGTEYNPPGGVGNFKVTSDGSSLDFLVTGQPVPEAGSVAWLTVLAGLGWALRRCRGKLARQNG